MMEEIHNIGIRYMRRNTNAFWRHECLNLRDITDLTEIFEIMKDIMLFMINIILMLLNFMGTTAVQIQEVGRENIDPRVVQKTLNSISYCNETICWLSCYLEMLQLTIEDGLFYKHCQGKEDTRRFPIKFNEYIAELNECEAYMMTSLIKDNLHRLYRNLRISHQFLVIRSNDNDFLIEGEGALFIILRQYKT